MYAECPHNDQKKRFKNFKSAEADSEKCVELTAFDLYFWVVCEARSLSHFLAEWQPPLLE
jgi:hypothetical protein